MIKNTHSSKFIMVISLLSIIIIQLSITNNARGQNVAITDNESYTAEISAMLDIMSTNKGMLVPRLTSAQRILITSPAAGLMVYDTEVKSFMYYNGSKWITIPQLASSAGTGEALFAVVNQLGDTVFAVYQDGVTIFVDPDAKGRVGGFAVSGRTPTKLGEKVEYFRVTPDSTRIYVNDSIGAKGRVGGFAVSGRTPTKGGIKEYFTVNKDSTRIYIDSTANKSRVGGFAVSGRTPTKDGYSVDDYFNISSGSAAEIINNEPRVIWYPKKAALLAGEIHVGSADSVGKNSTALGYRSIAMGDQSQAFGNMTKALGKYSTAIGNGAIASSENSFSFGNGTKALNINSFAIGQMAFASGIGSFALGYAGLDSAGIQIGNNTQATGDYSYAFGSGAVASNTSAIALGTNVKASGKYSLATGFESTASGDYSTALGFQSQATGDYSFATGIRAKATGRSVAIGRDVTAGNYSYAFGYYITNTGTNSLAIGIGSGSKTLTMSNIMAVMGGSDVSPTGGGSFLVGDPKSLNIVMDNNEIMARDNGLVSTLNFQVDGGTIIIGEHRYTQCDADVITYGKVISTAITGTGAHGAQFQAKTNGSAAGLKAVYSFYPTFYNHIDHIPRRAADIVGGFTGSWGGEYLAFHVGNNGSSNDGGLITSEKMRISGSGKVHLTGTSDAGLPDGSGVLVIGDIDEANIVLDGNEIIARNDGTASDLYLQRDGGNVGIGLITPTYQLQLSSNSAAKPSSSAWTIASDIRLKDVKGPYTKGLKEILLLEPIIYRYKSNNELGIKNIDYDSYGFSAQDVQKIFPEAVNTDSKGFLDFDIHPILIAQINAIKEQQKIIENQQIQIEELKLKNLEIENIKSELEAIKAEIRGK